MPRYFIITILVFWLPVLVLSFFTWSWLSPPDKKAFWYAILVLTPATFVMEYVYIWTRIWTFSEAKDPLLGIRLWGVPVEEFSFWFGATPFILLVYLTARRFIHGGAANGES